MKRMLVVIALGAYGAKLLLQFLWTHDLGHGITSCPTLVLMRNSVTVLRSHGLDTRQLLGKPHNSSRSQRKKLRTQSDVSNIGWLDEGTMSGR